MSTKRLKRVLKQVKSESGQVLILVLLLLLVSGLLLPPLLMLSMTGINAGHIYESKAHEAYAADSGLDHALWQLKYGDLESILTSPAYDIYDYNTTWSYNLSEQINTRDVGVSLEHEWIPLDISTPDKVTARNIIESGKLMVFSGSPGASICQVYIIFSPDPGEELDIETLGVWLSPGFEYVADSSSFGAPTTQPHAGGQVLFWDFDSTPFLDFPGVDPESIEQRSSITFQYTASQPATIPATISWVTTSGVPGVSYTWDADSRVYHITSIADGTKVESYNVKCELRKLGSAIPGDYFAIGNTLLEAAGGSSYRNRLHEESSATVAVDDIPAGANIEAAYLYWSGWMDWADYIEELAEFTEDCDDMSGWNGAGPDWDSSENRFRGHHSGTENQRYLTMKKSIDIHDCTEVTIAFDYFTEGELEDTDGLDFAISADDGVSWSENIEAFRGDDSDGTFRYTLPSEYLTSDFMMRFYLVGTADSGEFCYLDNVFIYEGTGGSMKYPVDPTGAELAELVEVTARVNVAMFNGEQVTADEWHILESIDLPGEDTYEGCWSYSCFYDATSLVEQWIDDEDIEENGAGAYTLGHVIAENEENPGYSVDLYPSGETGYPLAYPADDKHPPTRHNYCYGGWSLILIYTDASTKGRQIYLYDDQLIEGWHNDPDFDDDGSDGGTISGFLIPEDITWGDEVVKLTAFVGEGDNNITPEYMKVNGVALSNSASPYNNVWNSRSPGLTIDGIDIDTFTVDYPTLMPGDTSAVINLPTGDGNPNHPSDGFTLIYIILSFRSQIKTSDSISYTIGYNTSGS